MDCSEHGLGTAKKPEAWCSGFCLGVQSCSYAGGGLDNVPAAAESPTGQTEPNPVQLLPTLNKALISGCVRGAALLEASAPLMEKGKTLSLSTFLMTLRQEWLYPNPTEEQECYRQCFKYLMFTQHSEYKWQFKEKGTPVSVSSSGSFLFMCVFQLD